VVAFFGSEGLHCFDIDGQLMWKHDFGKLLSGPYDAPELEWGFASSPIIHSGRVIVQCDCLNANFVAILDIKTGEETRRIDRDDDRTSTANRLQRLPPDGRIRSQDRRTILAPERRRRRSGAHAVVRQRFDLPYQRSACQHGGRSLQADPLW
jgi:hypothetical protein